MAAHRALPLDDGWEMVAVAPGTCITPEALAAIAAPWLPARVPGTVASALRAAGQWTLDDPRDLDALDWWFRCEFRVPPLAPGERALLRCDGLATLADLYLNGHLLGSSDNMFLPLAADPTAHLREDAPNVLAIRFRALTPALAARRPRPRWRPRIIEQQALRFFRTTLLGRMPSWCPPVKAVGPWRPIVLELHRGVRVVPLRLRAVPAGEGGSVEFRARLEAAAPIASAHLEVAGHEAPCDVTEHRADGSQEIAAAVSLPHVARWWPHTHGAQPRYTALLRLRLADGSMLEHPLGSVAFRSLELDRGPDGDGFGLRVNGVPIFCRGACWTPLDLPSLAATPDALDAALQQARAAGMNMLRLSGTMVYESDAFYERCDALGVLVWQDFMFANMDYPIDEPAFAASVRAECEAFLTRTQSRACVAVLCGGSEVEQQAAMLGVDREWWQGPLTTELLPGLAAEHRPDAIYLTNSPTGGALPFHVNAGVGHYYGVGAYLRPLDDARRADVRFTSECLAFANVPEAALIESLLAPTESPVHHPRWKRGVPRDAGAGWDFEDVRDHYHRLLFGVDPMLLRYAEMERYLAQARVVTGEVVAATLDEWRRPASSCRGAIVWFLRDLWPGAGWGVLDVTGQPKAVWHYLRRASQPVGCSLTDEGVNGLAVHLQNERPVALHAELTLTAYRGESETARAVVPISLAPHAATTMLLAACFDGFQDFTHAYRFGPPAHDVVAATLTDPRTGATLATAVQLPLGLGRSVEDDLGLSAVLEERADGWYCTVRTRRFAQAVHFDVPGWAPDDDYFPLLPGGERSVQLRPVSVTSAAPRPRIEALNSGRSVAAGRAPTA